MRSFLTSCLGAALALTIATGALAQSTGNADVNQQLQQLLSKKGNQNSLGQGLALGMLVNCTQKQAGKEATQVFYKEMQTISKTVQADCKANNATGAQQLVLQTLDAKQNDPVLKSALTCYDTQSSAIAGMAGQKTADEMAHYATWAKNPALAHQQMKPKDICH